MDNYIGKHEKGAESLFDAMIADLFCDKANRTEKYMRTHDRRGKAKDKRKSYEKERYYKFDPWHGLEPVSHYRHRVYVESMLKDFDAELHQHEYAVSVMRDYMVMSENHEMNAESLRDKLLDMRINGSDLNRTIAESLCEKIRYEERRADDTDTEAKVILKGEMYK